MKTLAVVGSRSFVNHEDVILLKDYLQGLVGWMFFDGYDHFVSGGADGPDKWGEEAVYNWNLTCPSAKVTKTIIYPNWNKYGRSAGFRRNKDIIDAADHVLIFWDGESKGTKHDIDLCKETGTPYTLYWWDSEAELWMLYEEVK